MASARPMNRVVAALRSYGGIDLTLQAGETVALVAPSGAGKSTLLHIAGLLDSPDAGEISINGQSLANADDRKKTRMRRQKVGFVYQFHHLLPEFSAVENIALPQLANGKRRSDAIANAEKLLELLGLGDRADHRPAALSRRRATTGRLCSCNGQ